jgi:hypothetical protein
MTHQDKDFAVAGHTSGGKERDKPLLVGWGAVAAARVVVPLEHLQKKKKKKQREQNEGWERREQRAESRE